MDGTFSNGLSYPGDPNGGASETVNCRCTVAFLTPDEMAERAPRMIERRVARAVFTAWEPSSGRGAFRAALAEAA